jgi:hypothetical protein
MFSFMSNGELLRGKYNFMSVTELFDHEQSCKKVPVRIMTKT